MFELSARIFVASLGFIAISVTCVAQDKGQVKEQSKTMAAQLRQAGEPMDRCLLGARVVDGGIVAAVDGATALQPGDRLLRLNQIDVSGKTADQVVSVLRGISPGASIGIDIERDSAQKNVTIVCENSRPLIETILAGLDAAGRGKFDECVTAFSRRNDLGAFGAGMKLQCAGLAKNPNAQSVASLGYEAANEAIAEAHWAPSLRPAVISGLRQTQGMISRELGDARYQELVSATQKWPGGESMFKNSEPDMVKFRRIAEQALIGRLFDPESARIEWPYGFLNGYWKPLFQKKIEGYWTCGMINAKNRMGGYVGAKSFVVVVSPDAVVRYVEIGTGDDFDLLAAQCANSSKVLPPAPTDFGSDRSEQVQNVGVSIADEVKKLVELKESGALTDAEFQSAKQKLLSKPDNP